jgi:tetratricopeptide (TPR) repeat protein
VAVALFFFTGPAIVVYLNEVPITPRERDYVHVGSFMVFAVWIGLSVSAIFHTLMKYSGSGFTKWALAALPVVLVPGLILHQNWDDHDRSGRYAARDFGKNILSSCEENAILFTTADNDTYPIWYLQQVECFRPDVRQVLTPFLGMDWYGNQMNQHHEGSGVAQVSFRDEELLMNTNQYFPVLQRIDSSIDVEQLVRFIRNSDRRTQVRAGDGEWLNYIPGNKLSLAVNADNFMRSAKKLNMDQNDLPEKIDFSINKNYLTRDELLILDILANNNWKRPVYTMYPSLFQDIGLTDYLHREGLVFRLLPYKNTNSLHDRKAFAAHQFGLVTQEFVWGNVNDPDVFIDHTIRQNVVSFRFRQMFAEVAQELIETGQADKAEQLVDLALEVFPANQFPYDYYSADLVRCYHELGETAKADALAEEMFRQAESNLNYYLGGVAPTPGRMTDEAQLQAYLMQELIRICSIYNSPLHEKLIAESGNLFNY